MVYSIRKKRKYSFLFLLMGSCFHLQGTLQLVQSPGLHDELGTHFFHLLSSEIATIRISSCFCAMCLMAFQNKSFG